MNRVNGSMRSVLIIVLILILVTLVFTSIFVVVLFIFYVSIVVLSSASGACRATPGL